MNIAQFSVNRPVAVVMRIAALVLLGIVCLGRLPVDLLPKVSLPTISVMTEWPNVAPEEMEAQVTRPVERAVSQVTGLYQVTSTSMQGVSQVRIQLQWGTDIGQAAVEVLQLVQRAKRQFPNDATLRDPIVNKFDPTQMPILVFGISGMSDAVKLRTLIDNQISPMIESADGVASAAVTGGEQRAVIVDVDPSRLRAHHITLSQIMGRLMAENLNLPAGIAKESNTEYTIRSLGWFKSPREIGNMPLGSFNGQLVRLKDVAEVRDFHDETRAYARLNSKPSVGLTITKQSGANTIATADSVFEQVKRVKKLYPELDFGLAFDQSSFIRNSVNNVRDSAILGGILAILILLFFLRNVRSTLVVALSIPTSIISTFALLYLCGFTINTMSLGGLALATGLIVDDAVVVLENIFRHIERDKKSTREAAVTGTMEIVSAVVASTWTVMVVFLPLLLIKGQAGQMFTQFALVVIFSLAVSLLDATTVVPMLATRFIKVDSNTEAESAVPERRGLLTRAFAWATLVLTNLDSTYRRGLAWALDRRALTLIGAFAITAGSFVLFPLIGKEMMPQSDSGDFNVSVKLPVGTALSSTNEAMKKIETMVQSNPNVMTVFSSVGTGRGSFSRTPYQGSLTVKLKDKRNQSTQEVMSDLRRQLMSLPGVNARPMQRDIVAQMMTGGNSNIEVDIFGDDLSELSRLSKEVMMSLRGIPGLENVDVGWEEAMPEIQWVVDREKAQQMGVSFSDVANVIGTATNGTIATYYQERGFQYPIIVQMPEERRKTVKEMGNLVVRTGATSSADGSYKDVLLNQVATAVYGYGPSQIDRMDRRRYVAIVGMPQGRAASDIESDVQQAMDSIKMPSGFYWDWGTNQKRQADEFGGMGVAVLLAIALIYMLLASQFESFIHPLTILFSVPLAATGVILSLFLTGRTFGLTAFIGVLMLVGIVVKNGILLVDYTNQLRRRGLPRKEALLTAGPTRLRPILMTASAAIFGMVPLALALGKGSEIQAPMATVVIGGLITSTFLTLFVVPTVYSVFDDLAHLFQKKRKESA
ncbi:MAG: efflux RND transporter permease subunit [Armatimonadetes bacterium]|nr:efflux RND transporter permease subunit [Armatimonadota bacterium]